MKQCSNDGLRDETSSMTHTLIDTDTIVAISTPPGRGGIGVVRLSGAESLRIADAMLRLRSALEAGRARFGELVDTSGERIDEVVTTYFAAPHSYTSEDVVEIAAHGSPVVLEWIVRRAADLGARPARPGEFTERAFLSGRIDLTGAEAVRDLIDAQTVEQARVAAQQIGGALAAQVRPVKQQMVELIAVLEAGIDFAEDDIDVMPQVEIGRRIDALLPPLRTLLASFGYGRVLREGLRLAIVGRPNAGKSSLFNQLVERERAIVTAVAGTTRDVVTERLSLSGIPVELMDTAGLREAADEVEQIGIAKSHEAMADADVVLLVMDASTEMSAEEKAWLQALAGRHVIVVRNKIDLARMDKDLSAVANGEAFRVVATSALTGEGIPELRASLLEMVRGGASTGAASGAIAGVLTNLRQQQAVDRAVEALDRARKAVEGKTPHEMLLLDIYEALRGLDELTGETTADDVLNLIFSTFCIGK